MKVVGFAGYSRSGKTTLVEQLVGLLASTGARVAVIKHAHHRFDVDQPGKDSWRHRRAGACEVLVASDIRMALMREYPEPREPGVHALIAQIDRTVDWLLVEGFRGSDLPKIEVWRAPGDGYPLQPAHYPHDAAVVAVATTAPASLPVPTALPVLDASDAAAVMVWLQAEQGRFFYPPPAAAPAQTIGP